MNGVATKRLTGTLLGVSLAIASLVAIPAAEAAREPSPAVEAVTCEDEGAIVVRMYRAYFNRVPDRPGLEYWSDIYRQVGVHEVAFWMSQSPEYAARWTGVGDRQYVTELLYNNLLQRDPDAGGLEYWVGLISQVARDQQALFWVQTPEVVGLHPVEQPSFCGASGDGDGYAFRDIPGGRAVDVDYTKVDLKTSASRCGIASINANWFVPSGADYGKAIGFGVIDGAEINHTPDDSSRGILGERYRSGPAAEFTHDFGQGTGQLNQLSNWAVKGDRVLEMHGNYWVPSFEDPTTNWRWAAGGISIMVDGQRWWDMPDGYTYGTSRHSFVAFKAPSTVTFGSTTGMTAFQLLDWLEGQGYTDVMKMDGGGSVEFNEYGRTTVAGTARPIPVWFGFGCN